VPLPKVSIRLGALIVGLIATISACSTTSSTSTESVDSFSPAPIVVGSLAAATGSGATYGISQQRGIALAVNTLADGAIKVVTFDDLSTNAGATAAMASALANDPSAIVGPTLSSGAAAADPLAQTAGVPVLAASNSTVDITAIGDMIWRVILPDSSMIPQAVAAAAKSNPIHTAGMVWEPADSYSAEAAKSFRAAAPTQGITISSEAPYIDGSTTIDAVLAKATASKPDALFLPLRSAVASDFLKTAAKLALPQIKIGGNGFNSMALLTSAGSAADGLIVATSWNIAESSDASSEFVAQYREAYGIDPDAFAAQGYAAVQVLLGAITAGGGSAPTQVQQGLKSLGTLDTVLGRFSFDDKHNPTYPAVVQVATNGTFAVFGS